MPDHNTPEPVLGARFTDAVNLAAELHRTQARKGTRIPYLSHLLGVASLVLEHGGSETQAIAALLHDAVEDQGGKPTLDRIRAQFGDEVAAIVEACTDTDPDATHSETPEEKRESWRRRKERYLAHLAHAPADALLVSAADKLHNARAILADHRMEGAHVFHRFNAGRDGTLWYYGELAKAFAQSACPASLAEELRATVEELQRRAEAEAQR